RRYLYANAGSCRLDLPEPSILDHPIAGRRRRHPRRHRLVVARLDGRRVAARAPAADVLDQPSLEASAQRREIVAWDTPRAD
ncbi:MAG: hypothetical protein LBV34_23755, partial [Nocardiopsaceae bacterium]|nr:hypothetical protein [Nocardiopsaceae bacterium]